MTEADYRSEDTLIGSERAQLLAFVHDNRTEIVALLEGLTEEQARRRLVPSATTLLGIVKHCAFVERVWFHVSLAGRSREEVGIPESRRRQLGARGRRHRRVGPGRLPGRVGRGRRDRGAVRPRRPGHAQPARAADVRWIYVHMVEELARHAGHGDILREQVLAAG